MKKWEREILSTTGKIEEMWKKMSLLKEKVKKAIRETKDSGEKVLYIISEQTLRGPQQTTRRTLGFRGSRKLR